MTTKKTANWDGVAEKFDAGLGYKTIQQRFWQNTEQCSLCHPKIEKSKSQLQIFLELESRRAALSYMGTVQIHGSGGKIWWENKF